MGQVPACGTATSGTLATLSVCQRNRVRALWRVYRVPEPLRTAAEASGAHGEVEFLRHSPHPVVSPCEERTHSAPGPGGSGLGSILQRGRRGLVWGQARQRSSAASPAQLGQAVPPL